MKRALPGYLPGILLFVMSLLVGMLVYQDYGISWDERIQRTTGTVAYEYVFNGNNDLLTYQDRTYGTGFELPLIILEKVLHITDTRDVYLMRHLATHIFFLIGAFFAYMLVFRLYRNKFLACVAFLMLVTAPRLYAHSFFNSKDIPFLVMTMMTLAVCQLAFDKNRKSFFFLLGMVCGYTTSIRIMGVMFLGIVLSLLIMDLVTGDDKAKKTKGRILNMLFFIAGFCGSLYVAWPYLWHAPLKVLAESFSNFAHFNGIGDSYILFRGHFEHVTALPMAYVPVWFSISTPILWLVCGLGGLVWVVIDFFSRPASFIYNTRERNFLVFLGCFAAPALAVMVMHSVLYDDWRHLYFIYPGFLLLGIYFMNKLLQKKYRVAVQAAIVLQVGVAGYYMVQMHPFQQVYFNSLVSDSDEHLRNSYDLEYWGASYKQALEYLLAKYPDEPLRVSSNFEWNEPLKNNIMIQQERDRKRIEVVRPEDADFFITNFRNHREDFPYGKVEYSRKVLNSTIICIYKTH